MERWDVAVVGAGAAGLMAAIRARRTDPGLRLVLLDGAPRIGAKILISGGGRCNVTHEAVDERDFAGSTPAAIRKVLKRFGVDETVRFFEGLGVPLEREATGKLFPVANRARAVLDALLRAVADARVELRTGHRVESVTRSEGASDPSFRVAGPWGELAARRVLLAAGGRSVPETGSDGHGYTLARSLGHETTRLLPALVPLTLPEGHPFRALRGVSQDARLDVVDGGGRRVREVRGAVLLTHFGLSGPGVLDASRHLLALRAEDPAARLEIAWLPDETRDGADAWLRDVRGRVLPVLAERLTRRLAEALLALAGLNPDVAGEHLERSGRRALATLLTGERVEIVGSRGWRYAEVTAGGVPLREVDLDTMASRRAKGLHLCGEILDVDGRIGGFNFQWAWASGHVAGEALARGIAADHEAGG